ncbi:TRAP transporter TatT component family protein [Isoalcanivorax indicus]|uniref:TRAP transporter TatT component family protein n=1 Tax=Isoalcanivorax indicus TaxID=2202653 RepID=UPI000DB9FF1A|nr:TRAP transporter TatT component family protein [Isoalcanivorax indicus]
MRIINNLALLTLLTLGLSACAVTRVGDSLPYGILNNDDVELVADGLPTYLLMVDGLIVNWPRSEDLLRSGASLYGAYAGLVVEEPERQRALSAKALGYAERAACSRRKTLCEVRGMSVPRLEEALDGTRKRDVAALYTLGVTWAGYVQAHSDDWNAVADLARVRVILDRVVTLDERHEHGQATMYLAVLDSLLPEALGGHPAASRMHFERAIELSDGRNLLAKVLFAERYARMAGDQALHDELLQQVLDADPEEHGLTLQNTFARKEAERLLAESADYF